jgi:beta-galactosidase/beta-glucuronidase
VKRPSLNGKLIFLSGWLDQSFWPDGLFAAPTDAALEFDLQVVKTFGMNTVRLHQKVNSERWYYHADRLGIIILQDMPQKYGGASASTVQPFKDDMTRMINGKYNHPCIVQWTTFNEGDCYGVFDVPSIVSLARSLDPTRPVDTDSGGGANDLHIGDVNDIHTYPWPGYAIPSTTQYGMLGEYGGMGAYVSGHEWVPGQCQSYMASKDPEEECTQYLTMQSQIKARIADISCAIYTQITDLERECDGFLNYDRTSKFNADQTKRLFYANQDLINTVVPQ